MQKSKLIEFIKQAVKIAPEVRALLSNQARFAFHSKAPYKTQEYFLEQIERNVSQLYAGNIGGEFIDLMANLISGQLYDAYYQAWKDEGTGGDFPDYLDKAYQDAVSAQYAFVDQYYRDIVDAKIDGTPIEPLLARAELWATRWNEAYNDGMKLITLDGGGNLIWELGATEQHCSTCAALDGKVMSAKEWDAIGVTPQAAPNNSLECGGWKCDCSLSPTDARRTPGAYGRIEEIILATG